MSRNKASIEAHLIDRIDCVEKRRVVVVWGGKNVEEKIDF